MSDTPDRPDLDALGRLCDAATPGPWSEMEFDGVNRCKVTMVTPPSGWSRVCVAITASPYALPNHEKANAALIAAARSALPALIAYARRVEGERDALRGDISASVNEAVAPIRAECARLRGLVADAAYALHWSDDHAERLKVANRLDDVLEESTHVR